MSRLPERQVFGWYSPGIVDQRHAEPDRDADQSKGEDLSATTILVAGATGTNGSELLRQLANKGIHARAMVRDPERAANLACDTVELVRGDLSDRSSLAAALDGIEKAYIVTAVHKDTEAWFESFFAAAKEAGVSQLVKFSGMRADVESLSEIIRQHGRTDETLMESGIPYTILRPNSFYQNMLWQAEAIRANGQFYLPIGDARQSQVDVRDIAEATVRILTEEGHENKAYDFTGPESISYFDVAATLSKILDKPVTYVPVPVAAAEAAMLEAGMPEWDAHALAEIQGLFATGIYAEVTDDLEKLLGRRPRTFEDFARDFAAAFSG